MTATRKPDIAHFLTMFRASDPATSRSAAASVWGCLGRIQRAVLREFVMFYHRTGSAMSAREAERLTDFRDFGPSTVRKRVSELARAGLLEEVGTETACGHSPCTTYRPTQDGVRVFESRGILGIETPPAGGDQTSNMGALPVP